MSTVKKNGQRAHQTKADVVATRDSRLLRVLQSFRENDLTNRVLRPLFLAMSYDRVEFYGGVAEGGKDLICYGKDELGERLIAAVQVKRYKPSARARDEHSFGEIVTQLSQAIEKNIVTLDGAALPTRVYFVTPFCVDTRALESRFEKYESLRHRGMKIIDGAKLAHLLSNRCPELVRELVGDEPSIHERIAVGLNNHILMRALGTQPTRNLSQFFTDIDVTLGRWTTRMFLSATFNPCALEIQLDRNAWRSLQCAASEALQNFHVPILLEEADAVEDYFTRKTLEYAAWVKKHSFLTANRHDTFELTKKLSKTLGEIRSTLSGKVEDLSKRASVLHRALDLAGKTSQEADRKLVFAKKRGDESANLEKAAALAAREERKAKTAYDRFCETSDFDMSDFDRYRGALMSLHSRKTSKERRERMRNLLSSEKRSIRAMEANLGKPGSLRSLAERFYKQLEATLKFQQELESIPSAMVAPTFTVNVTGAKLARALEAYRTRMKQCIAGLNRSADARVLLRFLKDTEQSTKAIAAILADDTVRRVLGLADGSNAVLRDTEAYRLSVPLNQIIETGHKLLVLGEAGAGKTTGLQMYAKHVYGTTSPDEHLCLYVPLARMAKVHSDNQAIDGGSLHLQLTEAISAYCRSIDIPLTASYLLEAFGERRVTLLLDGLDEAIRATAWLIDAMDDLIARFPRVQIVTSSRMSGAYIERIPMFAIALLPFTDLQQERFLRAWCGPKQIKIYTKIKQHLQKNTEIRDVVRNPLLATVLCVLAENDVDLPDTESLLYEERLNLLTGHYDLAKGVPARVKSRQPDLIKCARKMAFWMHKNGTRDDDRTSLIALLVEEMQGKLSSAKCRLAVDELFDPCNVLVPMTEDGRIGFGHLRYQEHLAAEEMCHNRSIAIEELLANPAWRGALILFARKSDDLEWLIGRLASGATTSDEKETLLAMVRSRPKAEQHHLLALIKIEIERKRVAKYMIDPITNQRHILEDEMLLDSFSDEEDLYPFNIESQR